MASMPCPGSAGHVNKTKSSDRAALLQEGELRPQLLDRFGMSVNVLTMQDIPARTQMVLDRMAFERVWRCGPHTPVHVAVCLGCHSAGWGI